MRCPIAILTLLLLLVLPLRLPGEVFKANTPAWSGEWIWCEKPKGAAPLLVDLRSHLEHCPGGWGEALSSRIIANAASAGVGRIYWRLEDSQGKRLYPSSSKALVLKWPNWGVDFAAFDFPASALTLAKRLGLELYLVGTEDCLKEARIRYPDASFAAPGDLPGKTISSESLDPNVYAKEKLDHSNYEFARDFEVSGEASSARICITAQGSYKLYFDSTLIGTDSDWWRGETYDISGLMGPGRHMLKVVVRPSSSFAGLLLNMEWRTSEGKLSTLNTGLDWHCRRSGSQDWKPVSAVGFEGAGPWFRLKGVWQNPTPLSAGDRKNAEGTVEVGADKFEIVERTPSCLSIALAQALTLNEIRIHPGFLDGKCALKSYSIRWRGGNGDWGTLVPSVANAEEHQGWVGEVDYVMSNAFSPCLVKELKIETPETDGKESPIKGVRLFQTANAETIRLNGHPVEIPLKGTKNSNTVFNFKPVSSGILAIDFDLNVKSKEPCFTFALAPQEADAKVIGDISPVWLLWDASTGTVRYYHEEKWKAFADFKPGKDTHVRIAVHLSGPDAGTFSCFLDGCVAGKAGMAWRNPMPEKPLGSLWLQGRCSVGDTGSLRIDNLAVSIVPDAQSSSRLMKLSFFSDALGRVKDYLAVLPEGYLSSTPSWPALYILHGRGRNERSLLEDGACFDALLKSRAVVVLPSGDDNWYIDSPVNSKSRYNAYMEELLADSSKKLNLSADRARVGIAGWSMGGYGCAIFASDHPDRFSAMATIIGLLDFPRNGLPKGQSYNAPSSIFGSDPALWDSFNPSRRSGKFRAFNILLMTGDGAFDRTMNENFADELRKSGIRFEWKVLPGGHTFDTVRFAIPHVIDFMNAKLEGTH